MAMILRLVKRLDWKDRAKSVVRWDGALWVALIIIVLSICITLLLIYWEDLRGSQDSLGTTIRTVTLVIGGMIAVILAMWRSRVAERQATTAQQGLLSKDCSTSAIKREPRCSAVQCFPSEWVEYTRSNASRRSIGSNTTFRLCACSASSPDILQDRCNRKLQSKPKWQRGTLTRLSLTNPTRYGKTFKLSWRQSDTGVVKPSFSKSIPSSSWTYEVQISATLDLIGPNLAGADFTKAKLRHAHLVSADLSNAVLWDADLSSEVDPGTPMMFKTLLDGVNLCGANLMYANLSGARLPEARLCHSNLFETNLSSTFLYGAKLISADISLANLSGGDTKKRKHFRRKTMQGTFSRVLANSPRTVPNYPPDSSTARHSIRRIRETTTTERCT